MVLVLLLRGQHRHVCRVSERPLSGMVAASRYPLCQGLQVEERDRSDGCRLRRRAIASPEQEEKLLEIRGLATKLVAIGSCAVAGNFSTQRNEFPPEVQEEIHFLLEKFHYGKKAKKLDELVTVDAKVNGCPMSEEAFIKVLNDALVEFGVVEAPSKA